MTCAADKEEKKGEDSDQDCGRATVERCLSSEDMTTIGITSWLKDNDSLQKYNVIVMGVVLLGDSWKT